MAEVAHTRSVQCDNLVRDGARGLQLGPQHHGRGAIDRRCVQRVGVDVDADNLARDERAVLRHRVLVEEAAAVADGQQQLAVLLEHQIVDAVVVGEEVFHCQNAAQKQWRRGRTGQLLVLLQHRQVSVDVVHVRPVDAEVAAIVGRTGGAVATRERTVGRVAGVVAVRSRRAVEDVEAAVSGEQRVQCHADETGLRVGTGAVDCRADLGREVNHDGQRAVFQRRLFAEHQPAVLVGNEHALRQRRIVVAEAAESDGQRVAEAAVGQREVDLRFAACARAQIQARGAFYVRRPRATRRLAHRIARGGLAGCCQSKKKEQ